jgi:UDP-perosamine 4-acetyltransferase
MTAVSSIAIIGAGGHGRVVADLLRASIAAGAAYRFAGFIDTAFESGHRVAEHTKDWTVIGGDADISDLMVEGLSGFCIGIGLLRGGTSVRERVFHQTCATGLKPFALIHPSAIIAPDVKIGAGTVVMAGSVINTGSRIGRNSIINTGTHIDHDVIIGDHVHIAPGSTLSGDITVSDRAMIGVGSSLIQGITVREGATVGAGSVVVRSVASGALVMGIPAKTQSDR